MKRTILFLTMVFCAAALVLAHGNNRWEPGRSPGWPQPRAWGQNTPRSQTPRPAPESVSVSGKLTITQGRIAVVSGDITWLVGGIIRYVGFIDGLKEGAQVTLEGYAMPAGAREKDKDKNIRALQVQKMTLNGKDYELSRPQSQQQQDANPGPLQWHHPRRRL